MTRRSLNPLTRRYRKGKQNDAQSPRSGGAVRCRCYGQTCYELEYGVGKQQIFFRILLVNSAYNHGCQTLIKRHGQIPFSTRLNFGQTCRISRLLSSRVFYSHSKLVNYLVLPRRSGMVDVSISAQDQALVGTSREETSTFDWADGCGKKTFIFRWKTSQIRQIWLKYMLWAPNVYRQNCSSRPNANFCG